MRERLRGRGNLFGGRGQRTGGAADIADDVGPLVDHLLGAVKHADLVVLAQRHDDRQIAFGHAAQDAHGIARLAADLRADGAIGKPEAGEQHHHRGGQQPEDLLFQFGILAAGPEHTGLRAFVNLAQEVIDRGHHAAEQRTIGLVEDQLLRHGLVGRTDHGELALAIIELALDRMESGDLDAR